MATCPHLSLDNCVASLQQRFIYKDQCTKCFKDHNSPEGVDLCLKCLNGGCPHHGQKHFQFTEHPLVLNFKNILKKKASHESVEKKDISKVAIGKEGGADFGSQDEYETITELKCLACKKTLDKEPIKNLVDSIIKAETSYVKSGLVAWELEIKPCDHIKNLAQNPPAILPPDALKHCAQCDLSNNLWLCLSCGALGCGRANWDGTGGKGHAMDHRNASGHNIVVKMGTITPDGNASVHCYTCDEEVQDLEISKHLNNFGIRVENQVKTEKTISELTLSLNLNFTLSKTIEEGRKLENVFGPGLTGLDNLGNSCYMNSVLQMLFTLEEFKDIYSKEGKLHLELCNKYSADCFICQFSKIGTGLLSGEYSIKKEEKVIEDDKEKVEYYQDGLKIHNFKTLVGKDHPEFSSNRQQDAVEYMQYLFSYIQKIEKQNNKPDITNIFKFTQATKLSCLSCGGVKLRENPTTELKINCPYIKQEKPEDEYPQDFNELCKAFLEGEVVDGVFCTKCGKKTNFVRKTFMKSFPKYLLVPIQRFVLDMLGPQKIQAYIHVELNKDKPLSFEGFKLPKLGANESVLPDEEADEGPKVNVNALESLKQMGFGDNRASRALLANNNDPEMAALWLFERMDDASLDQPFPKKQKAQDEVRISQENIEAVISMGFPESQAKFALKKSDNNVERAIDYLFSHSAEEMMEEEKEQAPKPKENEAQSENLEHMKPKYIVHGAIVHLGKSVHCGHYVYYARHNNDWILFNDRKVAKTDEPLIGKAYMLVLKRVE